MGRDDGGGPAEGDLLPFEGTGEVHFRLRATGVDVAVQVAGLAPDWEAQMMLLRAGTDAKELASNLLHLRLDQVLVPEHPAHRGTAARFAHVPQGTYQVAVMLFGPGGYGMHVDPRPLAVSGTEPREVVVALRTTGSPSGG